LKGYIHNSRYNNQSEKNYYTDKNKNNYSLFIHTLQHKINTTVSY